MSFARSLECIANPVKCHANLGDEMRRFSELCLEHFPLALIHSLRVGRNWRILSDKRREGANEFCARGSVSCAQPPFAAVL